MSKVEEIMILANCRPRGVTLIFSYIRRLWLFLGGQNFEFKYLLGFSEKKEYFWVLRFCEYFFLFGVGGGGGSSQYWTIFRGHFYAF